ncbi:hypothetical protein BG000_009652 [Podila horticola]|nr:hypothetical protein BG000_009652 [Podila horticola]
MSRLTRLLSLVLSLVLSLQAVIVSAQTDGVYHLYSKLPGNPDVGIWYLGGGGGGNGQPVRLAVDLVEWIARPRIVGGGPTRLGSGPYRYTGEFKGEVFATNDQNLSRDWFLIPTNEQDYIIAADPRGSLCWTAGGNQAAVAIKPFSGGDNQLFTFKPVIRE